MAEDRPDRYMELDPHEVHTMPMSLAELLFLNDSTSALVAASDYEGSISLRSRLSTAVIAISFPLLDKLLQGIYTLLDAEEPEYTNTIDILFSASELYVLREAAISQARYGKFPVGLSLLKKICTILFGQGKAIQINIASLEKLLEGIEGLDNEQDE